MTSEANNITLPNPTEVKKWLRAIEPDFSNELRKWGQGSTMDCFYGYTPLEKTSKNELRWIFTGAGLCQDASFISLKALKYRYGENTPCWIVRAKVLSNNFYPNKTYPFNQDFADFFAHFWIRFIADNGVTYFIDSTYGQINSQLNRIVIDRVDNEPFYFRYPSKPEIAHFNDTSHTSTMVRFFPSIFEPTSKFVLNQIIMYSK